MYGETMSGLVAGQRLPFGISGNGVGFVAKLSRNFLAESVARHGETCNIESPR